MPRRSQDGLKRWSRTINVGEAREALANLPEATSYGEEPALEYVYLPPSHLKAMDPNNLLVTGMRGAGKTYWWSALQNGEVRRLIRQSTKRRESTKRMPLNEDTEVRTGFGVKVDLDQYPSKDVLRHLMNNHMEPRMIWRMVQAWQLASDDHPLRQRNTWLKRARYVSGNPEDIDSLFQRRDNEFDRKGIYFIILFDAMDRCADDWKDMYSMIRGLLQTALDLRAYRRLRVKMFLRSDQTNASKIADFPDASKVIASGVELSWPRHELYGLLWHYLVNGEYVDIFRKFLNIDDLNTVEINQKDVVQMPRSFISKEELQREKFHVISGQWMGRGPRRGFPFTWIPNHLADTEGRVSPRSFLSALKEAAGDTDNRYPEHTNTLHFDSIKRGVQKASTIRVGELREDYPWVDRVLEPLGRMVVPCEFDEISERWRSGKILDSLSEDMEQNAVKLPPRHIDEGPDGVRQDLESLGVFQRLYDDRVNIPDVFRVGYGLGRRGGVKPVR